MKLLQSVSRYVPSAAKGTKIDQALLCYPLQHAARFEDEGGQDDSAEIGAGSEL